MFSKIQYIQNGAKKDFFYLGHDLTFWKNLLVISLLYYILGKYITSRQVYDFRYIRSG